jgi:hypothetical protein
MMNWPAFTTERRNPGKYKSLVDKLSVVRQFADKRKHTPREMKGVPVTQCGGVLIRYRATDYRLVIPAATVYWPQVHVYQGTPHLASQIAASISPIQGIQSSCYIENVIPEDHKCENCEIGIRHRG